jgi:uncharacterized protein (TIGR00730 family)
VTQAYNEIRADGQVDEMKRVAVFCGSKVGDDPVYRRTAVALADALAERGAGLVYGGGKVGLMGILADAALAAGADVIGVIPKFMVHDEVAHQGLTRLMVVDSMHERKAMMAELADAFLALPGGYGTLDELFEIVTWAQLGLHEKPIGLLDVKGYYRPLVDWVEHAVDEGFIAREYGELLVVADETEELLEELWSAMGDAETDTRFV